ncbi:hypothetical protein BH23THE1_BH23THE1_32520 [soil metagenome]
MDQLYQDIVAKNFDNIGVNPYFQHLQGVKLLETAHVYKSAARIPYNTFQLFWCLFRMTFPESLKKYPDTTCNEEFINNHGGIEKVTRLAGENLQQFTIYQEYFIEMISSESTSGSIRVVPDSTISEMYGICRVKDRFIMVTSPIHDVISSLYKEKYKILQDWNEVVFIGYYEE